MKFSQGSNTAALRVRMYRVELQRRPNFYVKQRLKHEDLSPSFKQRLASRNESTVFSPHLRPDSCHIVTAAHFVARWFRLTNGTAWWCLSQLLVGAICHLLSATAVIWPRGELRMNVPCHVTSRFYSSSMTAPSRRLFVDSSASDRQPVARSSSSSWRVTRSPLCGTWQVSLSRRHVASDTEGSIIHSSSRTVREISPHLSKTERTGCSFTAEISCR